MTAAQRSESNSAPLHCSLCHCDRGQLLENVSDFLHENVTQGSELLGHGQSVQPLLLLSNNLPLGSEENEIRPLSAQTLFPLKH